MMWRCQALVSLRSIPAGNHCCWWEEKAIDGVIVLRQARAACLCLNVLGDDRHQGEGETVIDFDRWCQEERTEKGTATAHSTYLLWEP